MKKTPRTTTAVELGNATVFVTRASLDLDRQGRGYYRCDVHPVGSAAVFRTWLRAAGINTAARGALQSYEAEKATRPKGAAL